jgi:hypothetical protein
MFKKMVVTSLIIANMYTPVYGGGMSVDALHQAEFYRTSLNPVISENVECAFENGNILLDFSYENTGETNLWTLKVLYKPGTFDPEVVEINMDNGNIHSIGMNSGSALSGANGYEVITVTFTDQVNVNIFEAGVYYNAVLPENPEKEVLEDEPKAGDTPIIEESKKDPEQEAVLEEPKKELEQEAVLEEPEEEIVAVVPEEELEEEIATEVPKEEPEQKEIPKESVALPEVEVPKENTTIPEVKTPKESVALPEVEVPKKRTITEESKTEVQELPKEEPMAEVDEEEQESNEGQEDTRQVEDEQDVDVIVSEKDIVRKTLLSIIGIETIILAVLIFMIIRYKKI